MTVTTAPLSLPSDFDVSMVGDDSSLPQATLSALRELTWRKMQTDLTFFLENFWYIVTVGVGYALFNLYDYQYEEVAYLEEAMTRKRAREVRLKARQIGWTTMGTGAAFHSVFFNAHRPWLIASQTEDDAKDTLRDKIKTPYLMLPRWVRDRGPNKLDDNAERMSFDNGSSIISIPATSSAGRSKAVFGVLLDEYAFATEAEGLIGALEPLCYGPMIVFSTANGMGNTFHELWLESQLPDSEWSGRFRPWHVVPDRDEKWYNRTRRLYRGRLWQFYQEYPASPEEAFAKSGRVVLPVDIMREFQDFRAPEERFDLSLLQASLHEPKEFLSSGHIPAGDVERELELWVWERPNVLRGPDGAALQQPNYVIACDVAEGLEHGDRTSISIIDANLHEEVASFLGHIDVADLGEVLEWLGYWYMTALIVVERNNHGILPIDFLRRAGYPRLFRADALAAIPQGDRTPRYGYVTSKATKPKMVNEMVRAMRDATYIFRDARLLIEAQTFIADGKGGYGASKGNYDDHVMGHAIAIQGCEDAGFYPIHWIDEDDPLTRWSDMLALQTAQAAMRQSAGLHEGIGQNMSEPDSRLSFFANQPR